jgi:DNA-binding PadR family transcriptional regulator
MATRERPGDAPAPDRATAEYALLGLLARAGTGEIHGYDLARLFGDGVLGEIVRLEPGMLYHYLKRLAKAGLITTRVERQVGRPDRQVHRIAPEGEEVLRAWIEAPVRSTREIRLEFLLKLYLARQVDPAQAGRLVNEQRRVMRSRAARLAEQVATAQPDTPDNAFGETVLRLRLSQTEAALAWLATLPEADGT